NGRVRRADVTQRLDCLSTRPGVRVVQRLKPVCDRLIVDHQRGWRTATAEQENQPNDHPRASHECLHHQLEEMTFEDSYGGPSLRGPPIQSLTAWFASKIRPTLRLRRHGLPNVSNPSCRR